MTSLFRILLLLLSQSPANSFVTSPTFYRASSHTQTSPRASPLAAPHLAPHLVPHLAPRAPLGPLFDAPDRLPASYRSDNGTRDSEFTLSPLSKRRAIDADGALSTDIQNPYVSTVATLSPSDLIGRFMSTAPPSVQDAVRTTILGLIGTLPKMAFETNTATTGAKLASLMFQLEMTGYMFKNAEYRMTLKQSLGPFFDQRALPTSGESLAPPTITGTIKVSYGESKQVEVEADAYMSELRKEVDVLRAELSRIQNAKDDAANSDMLAYIRALPEQQMRSLTGTITPDILDAMKQLVDTVLGGIGDGEIGPSTVTEQSSGAMAQLCMWQLVVGYNLRELEVREEMEQRMEPGKD